MRRRLPETEERAVGLPHPATGMDVVRHGESDPTTVARGEMPRFGDAEDGRCDPETALEAVINNIADPVFVKDAGHRFTFVNDALCDLMGVPREAVLGKCDSDFFPPEQVRVFLRQDEVVLTTGVPDVNEESISRADGEVRTISTKKARYTDAAGRRFIVGVIRDVTERTRTERERQLLQRRVQALLDIFRHPRTSDAAIVALALDRLTSLTESGLGFIGFLDPAEITMTTHVWSARAMQECAMDDVPTSFDVAGGGLWAAPVRHHRSVMVNDYTAPNPHKKGCPAGHVGLIRFLGVPLIRDGRVVLVVGLANKGGDYGPFDEDTAQLFLESIWEVIGHDRAVSQLSETRSVFDDVSAIGKVGGWDFDVATRSLHWTRETCHIHEVPESEVPDLAGALLFYDLPGRSKLETAMRRCMEHGEPFDLSLPFTSAKGNRLLVRATGSAAMTDGKVVRLTGIFQDNTDRRRLDERLATLGAAVEQSAESIVIFDLEGCVQYVNPAFERAVGYSLEESAGQNINDLLYQDLDQGMLPTIWETIRAGHVWAGRLNNRARDGHVLLLDATISPILDPSGATIGYVSARRDVTQQVQMEARVAQAERLEAVGTLAGGVAHDINNVLTAIVGHTQMALMKCADGSPVRGNLEVVLQGARRAGELVRQVLLFSRHTAPEQSLVQLDLLVKEAVKLLRAAIPSTVEVRTELRSSAVIAADPSAVHRVLVNLCTNAALAMDDAKGVIEIGLAEADVDAAFAQRLGGVSPGRFVRLWVRDTGRGMAPGVLARIFEPFFTTRQIGVGTGMGLAVVHGIIRDLHGAITAESTLGVGTTFEIFIPAAEGIVPDAAAPAAEIHRGMERVLLVDDDPLVLDSMADMLRELGYNVRPETSPAAALAAFEASPRTFDLVLTDMTMPGMTGLVLAGRLRDCRPDIPIVLATGYTEEQMPVDRLMSAVDRFVMKPVFMETLSEVLREVLGGDGRRTPTTGPDQAMASESRRDGQAA